MNSSHERGHLVALARRFVTAHSLRLLAHRSSALVCGVLALGALTSSMAACVTVKPQERTFLADPAMQFGADRNAAQVKHAVENREGSFGGEGVAGGGCGCN